MTSDSPALPAIPCDGTCTHYVLLADRAALPAVAAWLEARPEGVSADVGIEIEHEGERCGLAVDEDVRLRWLERHGMDVADSALLEDLLVEVELPDEDGVTCFWIATDVHRCERIARFLADDWGIDPAAIHTVAI